MRAVIQLVKEAAVAVDGEICGRIGSGLLVLLGVGAKDSAAEVKYMADKICNLRIFPDNDHLMNKSLLETRGEMLIVSQFTLYGDCRKGRRPSFKQAAGPDLAAELYALFIRQVRGKNIQTAAGRFQTHMEVSLINDGPVTIILP
ncbi:D-aminoacyl-tRNA deacylase [Desulfobacterota bacterium M19]